MVSSIRAAPAATLRKLAHLQRLLEPGAIHPVYQPIVRLADLEPIGYEGLARFPYADGLADMPPDVTLAAAGEIGLRGDLEVACWAAMAAAGSPPEGRLLFVNISPDALRHPGLFALHSRLPSRLVIEITEQREVQDYAELRELLAPWVARGAQVAIDDTGAGYASLEHVVELRPDFLKLTRGLVADIDHDPNRQALLRALLAFAREVGAVIVAEGVERREELEVLREAEVDFGQGWLFGQPAAAWPDLPQIDPPRRAPSLSDSGLARMGRFESEVATAETAKAACQAIVDHLGRLGLMPSVYLEQGGRLRCQAAGGYWMVYDGLPPEAGVIGATFRSGETTVVDDVQASGDYMPMTQAVKTEMCVPLRLGSRIIGAVNVESTTPLGEAPAREVERTAGVLARRLGELTALESATPGQRLARAAARAAQLEDSDAVVREAAAAALEVSGLESIMVALREGDGRVHMQHAAGPFAEVFAELGQEALKTMASWVHPGTTCLTMGDVSGKCMPAAESLRRAGAGALVLVPLAVGRTQLGFIALADRSTVSLDTEATELVELLGVQTAAQLRGLAAVVELRDRASKDPLTGLGHQEMFRAKLARRRRKAAAAGRRLAVVLADVDGIGEVNDRGGHGAGDEILRRMAALLGDVAPDGATAYRLGGDEFALLMETDGRGPAQEVAWQLQAQARERLGTTLSIGVAVAGARETDEVLLERASQAVVEVKRRGRDGVALAAAQPKS
ncbi:MAG TPA: EAL domain-containing protein [Solirubrobacteraceae bacterium]|nr:EAL domain-containing protein [Solirubrobacteraceae bacterium]